MELPEFIQNFHELDLPIPSDVVKTHAVRSDRGLVVIFDAFEEVSIPEHSHGVQWGTVISGSIKLTMDGETKIYRPGDTYNIPAGTKHAATVTKGSKVMDIFEENDRYPLK